MSNSDFKDKIAAKMLGITVEEVILNRGARQLAAREKWMKKNWGTSHVKRSNPTQWKTKQ